MSQRKLVTPFRPYKKSLPPVIGMTDPMRLADPMRALATLPQGSLLIWRLFGAQPSRGEIEVLRRKARQHKCRLLLAGHGNHLARADGVHVPERLLARRHFTVDPHQIVTASAHSERAIFAAKRAGIYAVLISPVFATTSHAGAKPLGLLRFAALARRARQLGLGVYALGGMNAAAGKRLTDVPINGLAGIGMFERDQA